MGKKKNKKGKNGGDFWGGALSANEQMSSLDLIADIEKGKKKGKSGDIFGLSKDVITDENGLPSGLMSQIAKDMNFSQSTPVRFGEMETVNLTSPIDFLPKEVVEVIQNPEEECVLGTVNTVNTKLEMADEEVLPVHVDGVRFILKEELLRMDISDQVVPVSLYIPTLLSTASIVLDESEYDSDQLGEDISTLFHYIISCKHPSAMFTVDDFNEFMLDVKDYDSDKYIFMILEDQFVLAYKVDGRKEFTEFLLDECEYTPYEVLKCHISASFIVGTVHSAFFVENGDYLEAFMNSKYNQTKVFIEEFRDDRSTKLGEKSIDNEHQLIDIRGLQTIARERISYLVGEDDDYEDEYFDEEDVELDIIIEDTKIPESEVEIMDTDASSLLEDVETTVEESSKVDVLKPTNDESMIVPVRTKKTTNESEMETN